MRRPALTGYAESDYNPTPCLTPGTLIVFLLQSKAIRTVFRWQACATAAMTAFAGFLWGMHAGLSALLGGLVSMAAGAVFAIVAYTGRGATAGRALRVALRAEAAKIIAVVLLLWLVLATYKEVVALGFLGAFAVTVFIFSAAVAVREEQ
jgi:ATP synthase protein I